MTIPETPLTNQQIIILRDEAERLLSSDIGQKIFREFVAMEGYFHGFPKLLVNSHEPRQNRYVSGDYEKHPERFSITNYHQAFYLGSEMIDRLIISKDLTHRKTDLERKLLKKIPDLDEKLRKREITVLDGAVATIRDSQLNFFVPAMELMVYADETIMLSAKNLAQRGYLLLSYKPDMEWASQQHKNPKFADYYRFMSMTKEEKEAFRQTAVFERFKQQPRPERRYKSELIVSV